MKKHYLALIAILFSATAAATPTTITFDPLAQTGPGWSNIQFNVSPNESAYTENGFVLSTFGNIAGQSGFGSAHSGQADYYFGSTALFNDDTNGGLTYLQKVGGGVFSLTSMKLAALTKTWSFYPGEEFVTFVGTRANGSTVEQKVLLLSNTVFQTVQFLDFNNLVSVNWAQGNSANKAFNQFDDIVIDGDQAPQSVPEPASIALLGLGLAALASKRRKA